MNKIDKVIFDSAASKYVQYLTNYSLLNKNFDDFKVVAHQLYGLIFQSAPVPNGRVIISPDGLNFPFESLIVTHNSSSPVYFLNDHAVSYTYSVRYLLNSFASNTTASGSFMGIAPVNFSQRLASLPGSDQSLSRIANYFGSANNLIQTSASKSNFIRQFANYSIIQVYTHAAANSNAKEPVIYFADSALYLSDLIPENKPATKLIVLSACETGDGQFYLGEGVFNFNRGFAAYGIPTSVTNLWSVENLATYKLTELFYKHLSRNLPIDIAMQQAKKEFIKTNSTQQLPYYWAAAIVVGKTEAPVCKPKESWAFYYIICGAFCLCAFGAVHYESKRLQIISI
ncbi:MAG: CHAT domain-containing protein [Chitinophagaceae bacterium]|nr:CHAT domain-containing protein [Chitinophagaceae bacterium]